jgi:two-component system phosphate regulon sensor histidine kinase PhoR
MSVVAVLLALGWLATAAVAWHLRSRVVRAAEAHARQLEEQRRHREAEFRAQAARTEALFDRMVEGILVVGQDGRLRLANRAAAGIFQFEAGAAGRTVLEATRHHEVAAIVARLAGEPEVLNHELRIDGVTETRWLQVNALALRTPEGEGEGAILVFHDLTRLRRLEGVRQEFVANVSHELRTPLSLIKSATETLIDGGRQDPQVTARFLEIIEKHANRLTLLLDDLLLLARLDSGRIDLDLRPVLLASAAQEAIDDAGILARGRGVTLVQSVPAGLAAHADAHRLAQALGNLIDNAIKYGREGGTVEVRGRELGAGQVEISVRDDGPGIAGEALERVFERFYRADKARAREQGGTGLGLAIVKNVVQAHGGDVRVESTPGRGTEFFIRLPAARE